MNARFDNDYLAGGHPALLQRLVASNGEETAGYGLDPYSDAARAHSRAAVGREDVAVHFRVGGTQTNCTVITAALRPHQAALAARTGHIVDHEAGAIEAEGGRPRMVMGSKLNMKITTAEDLIMLRILMRMEPAVED